MAALCFSLTCRWKGENVSTIEVSNLVSDISWIHDANVYGVEIPGECLGMEVKTGGADDAILVMIPCSLRHIS